MSSPLIPEQRQQAMLRMLRDDGVLSIRDLTEAMRVSHMTVRRDIAALEASGEVVPVQGGVMLSESSAKEPPRERVRRSALEMPSKLAIAGAAAAHLRDGMVVFVDAGTTCEAIVPYIAQHEGITVVTSDFHTVTSLQPHLHVEVIHTGGAVDRDRSAATGPLAAATVGRLGIDLNLMSTGSWDLAFGVTVPVAETALLKQAVLAASARSLLLADSTKFGEFTRHRVVPLSELHGVITDDRLDRHDRDALRAAGVELELTTSG